jgi:hypothetical protein
MAIKFLVAFLVIVAIHLGWWAVSTASFLWLIPALLSFVTAAGLLLKKRWSLYLWHSIALAVSLSWLASVIRIAMAGWPYEGTLPSLVSLLPGLLLLTLCAAGSAAVAKHFRGDKYAL